MSKRVFLNASLICVLMALLAASVFGWGGFFGTARAESEETPFMVFDDYDTAIGSAGRDSALTPGEKWKVLEQMLTFTLNPTATAQLVDEHFAPGIFSTRSLKISVGNDAFTPFYNQGQLANNDQSDAKYVKIYLRNDSGKAADYGIYLTDVPQSTLDGTAPSVDYGQEHWQLKWNAAVVLETLTGEQSVVVSTAGTGITIPKDFVGSVNIPINSKTLAIPGWYLTQNEGASNQVIDKDKIYCVSSVIPANNKDATFVLGEIWMKSDTAIDDCLAKYYGDVALAAEKVIRPVTSDFTVDFKEQKMTFPYELTYGEFLQKFSLPSGYEVVMKDPDGFDVSDEAAKVLNGSTVVFTDQKAPYTFEVAVVPKSGGDSGRKGCGGQMSTVILGSVATLGIAALILRRH